MNASGKFKILVLSDIHFPLTRTDELKNIVKSENADRVIFLGDIIQRSTDLAGFMQFVSDSQAKDPVFIIGDNEVEAGLAAAPFREVYEIALGQFTFRFMHGHQFNVRSDNLTGKIARILGKLNRRLPVFAYALRGRARRGGGKVCLVLGHCHALVYFPSVRVACSGCLTTSKERLYNDKGYVIVESGDDGKVELALKKILNGGGIERLLAESRFTFR